MKKKVGSWVGSRLGLALGELLGAPDPTQGKQLGWRLDTRSQNEFLCKTKGRREHDSREREITAPSASRSCAPTARVIWGTSSWVSNSRPLTERASDTAPTRACWMLQFVKGKTIEKAEKYRLSSPARRSSGHLGHTITRSGGIWIAPYSWARTSRPGRRRLTAPTGTVVNT